MREARVTVAGETVGAIGAGLLVLAGFTGTDTVETVEWMADKILTLRVFPDHEERMNRSLDDVDGAILVVSQFTLYGDVARGRRPSFVHAASPDLAVTLYEEFLAALEARGAPVASGHFGAAMDVALVNWGPVTLVIDR